MIQKVDASMRQLARAHWTVTPEGEAEFAAYMQQQWGDDRPAMQAQDYVGKRIKSVGGGGKGIPREIWHELLKRHKKGELEIAFLVPKNAGSAAGSVDGNVRLREDKGGS